jgi:hypothetical protein
MNYEYSRRDKEGGTQLRRGNRIKMKLSINDRFALSRYYIIHSSGNSTQHNKKIQTRDNIALLYDNIQPYNILITFPLSLYIIYNISYYYSLGHVSL